MERDPSLQFLAFLVRSVRKVDKILLSFIFSNLNFCVDGGQIWGFFNEFLSPDPIVPVSYVQTAEKYSGMIY